LGIFLAAGVGRKSFSESVKYMTISGDFKQTAGIQSRLGKVLSSLGVEKELFVFSRSLFMERSGEEREENRSTSSLGRKLL